MASCDLLVKLLGIIAAMLAISIIECQFRLSTALVSARARQYALRIMAHVFRALCVTVFVLLVHAFALRGDWYSVFQGFDAVMHLAGGFAMGLFAVALWNGLVTHRGDGRLMAQAIFVLGFVALIGIAWEWFEYALDHTLPRYIDGYGWAPTNGYRTQAD